MGIIATIFTDDDIHTVHRARITNSVIIPGAYDRRGVFLPSADEMCGRALLPVKYPTELHPFTYYQHCKSQKHIGYLSHYNPLYFKRLLSEAQSVLSILTHRQKTLFDL